MLFLSKVGGMLPAGCAGLVERCCLGQLQAGHVNKSVPISWAVYLVSACILHRLACDRALSHKRASGAAVCLA